MFAGRQEQEHEGTVNNSQSTQGLIVIIGAIGCQGSSRRMTLSVCVCWIKEELWEPAQVKSGRLRS